MLVHIRIEKDNYAYITTGSAKLFDLLLKSYTRETREYNIYWKRYINVTKKLYRLVNNKTTIKVKAGTIPFLVSSFSKRSIEYIVEDNRNNFSLNKENIELQLNTIVRLRDYQEQAVQATFENRYCSLQLMTGSGKEQPVSSKVLTPTGFCNIGDLDIGDDVIAGDGKVTKIIGKYPQGIKNVYKITFSDNTTAECGLEHIWTVSKEKDKKQPKFFNITLNDLLKEQQLDVEYGGRTRNWKYEIPLATVEGEEKDFIIQPYTLGVLIADGSLSGKEVCFSCSDCDYEIKDRVLAELDSEMRLSKNSYPVCPQYKIVHKSTHICYNKFRQEIIRLGLDVKSKYRFIPKEYLYGTSIQQRIELLQGLFDCDGTQAKNEASARYCTTSLQLANDVIELIQSLGFTATLNIVDRTKECKPIEYNINISSKDFCPFSLSRKAQYWRQSSDKTRRYIRKIEFVRQEECVCIEVESETKQYLTNNYIVTHNTEVSASIIKTYLKNSNKAALYVVPTIRLQKEAKERFEKYGIDVSIKPKTIIKGKVNILTYLGLVRSNLDASYKNTVGLLIFDEAQHLKAAKNSNIVHNFHNLDMCIGLSATLTENIQIKTQLNKLNNDDFGVFGSTGYPVYYKSIEETINDKFVTPIEVHVLLNYNDIKLSRDEMDWHTVKKEVLMSDDRTKYISEYITGVIKENNYNTMCILIPEVKWSQQFMLEFSKHYNDCKLYLTYGSDRYDEIIDGKIIKLDAEEKTKALENIKNPNIRTVFSATSYMYEGIDITNMQALVNVYGGKSSTRVKQQIGRATRLFKDKDKAFIYEICDINNPILKNQFNARLNIYRKEYKAEIIIDNKE